MRHSKGFGLLELLMALIIATLLISVAVPMYDRQIERAKVAAAIGDIGTISIEIDKFRLSNRDRVPDTLAELPIDIPMDPWGRPYVFLNIIDGDPDISAVRKDGSLNPLNTDYDLYSLGRDGDSKAPLNAPSSRDDIVRANDGAYIGLGEDF
ncbi:MAG: prepilin-type N-terminal cleavage/methylation domain-containing protein [Woeseiaceae bacterium]|nr:prepilin-type N-terminal cleavage/methylation domain-containing protein [Woeseiaceae bacterium]